MRNILLKLFALLIMLNLISKLFSAQKWEKIDEVTLHLDKPILEHEKDWAEASKKALEEKEQRQVSLSSERKHREKIDESSTSVDCGKVGSYPSVGVEIEASVHYFFTGTNPPPKIGENFTITFSVKIENEWDFVRKRDVEIITNEDYVYIPDRDGMGFSPDGKTKSSIILAMMNEKECRRLVREGIQAIRIGPITITHPEPIAKGLSLLVDDLDSRRKE